MNILLCYLAQIFFLFYEAAEAIDCYSCTSIGGDYPLCNDEFKKTIHTSVLIKKNCEFDYFKGTHCIKLKGIRGDGTEILVRQCGDNDWGSHCGDIVYINGNESSETVNGCLESCNHDGCNSSKRLSFQTSVLIVLLIIILIFFRL